MIIRAAKYLPVGSFLPSFHVQKRESYQRDVEKFLLWICDQTLEVQYPSCCFVHGCK